MSSAHGAALPARTAMVCLSLVASPMALAVAGPRPADALPGEEATYAATAGELLAEPAELPEDNLSVRRLLANIDNAPAGSTIRIVAFSLSLGTVADALLAAADRGVGVQVLVDSHSRRYGATRRLLSALGSDLALPSYAVAVERSARGAGPKGQLHQKTWMFSQTGDSHLVVMVGSTNLTTYGTTDQYSDMFTFVGRADVWAAFNRVFEEQALDRPSATRPLVRRMGDVTAWFGPGFRRANDPVRRILSRIRPRRAEVRIGAFAWWDRRGERLARQVIGLSRRGAKVRILTGIHVSRKVRAQLRKGGLSFFRGAFAGGDNIHLKMVLVHDRARDRRYVVTGSDNWSDSSFHKDDLDIVIPLDRRQYRRYVRFFESVVDRSVEEYGPPR